MEIEYVSGICLAAGRSSDKQGYRSVRDGVLAEVIVNYEDILALVHKVFAHGAARIRRDVLHRSELGRRCGDYDGVVHGSGGLKGGDDLSHRGLLLSDGNVDADHVLIFLIDDRIDSDSALSRLPVADYKLALASPDRYHGVDSLDTCLQRNGDALSLYYSGRGGFDGAVLNRVYLALTVDRRSEGVYDPADELFAHRYGYDLARALYGISLSDALVAAEDNDGYGVLLEVLSHAHLPVRELDKLVHKAVCKPRGSRYSVSHEDNGTRLRLLYLRLIVFDLSFYKLGYFFRF